MTLGKAGQGAPATTSRPPDRNRFRGRNGDISSPKATCADLRQFRITKVRQNASSQELRTSRLGRRRIEGPTRARLRQRRTACLSDRSNAASRSSIRTENPAGGNNSAADGIFIDKNDVLYVSDSESERPGKDTNNPGCKPRHPRRQRQDRQGSISTFRHDAPKTLEPAAGRRAADSHGKHLRGAVPEMAVLQICEDDGLREPLHPPVS